MTKIKKVLKTEALVFLNRKIAKCKRCSLYKEKNCDVSGEGNPRAKILFIGEAPGREEDLVGKPFKGRAGKLLDSLFKMIKIDREKVFITNLVKHRPPKNRKPKPEEIKACTIHLLKQIKIINPQLIVLLGSMALKSFFPKETIKEKHGKYLKKENRVYLSLYHPAAAIYNQKLKSTLTKDFKKIKTYIKE